MYFGGMGVGGYPGAGLPGYGGGFPGQVGAGVGYPGGYPGMGFPVGYGGYPGYGGVTSYGGFMGHANVGGLGYGGHPMGGCGCGC